MRQAIWATLGLVAVISGLAVPASSSALEAPRSFHVRMQTDQNNGTGTASVSVEPLGGELLLAGKGVGVVSRIAEPQGICAHPAVICSGIFFILPIRPVGEAARKLSEFGYASVRLTLTYTLSNGSRSEIRRSLTLRQKAVLQPAGLSP
jgi:hypothetical protein